VIFTVNPNIYCFFAWSTNAECSELCCNALIKTVNGDCPEKQGIVVRVKSKLHMLQGDIFMETRYHALWNSIHNTT